MFTLQIGLAISRVTEGNAQVIRTELLLKRYRKGEKLTDEEMRSLWLIRPKEMLRATEELLERFTLGNG